MTPVRHPSESYLAAYATGDLPLAPGLVVNAHLAACASCRAQVMGLEAQAGEELEAAPSAAMSPGRLDAALLRLDEPPSAPSPYIGTRRLEDVDLPAAAAGVGFEKPRVLARGLWVAHSKAQPVDGWRAFLLRAPAGTKLPAHEHRAEELMCVLSGALQDGQRFEAGDFGYMAPGSRHDLRVDSGSHCACLVATQAPLNWLTMSGRALGKVLRV